MALSCVSISAQSLVVDTHRSDSVMWKMQYRFGKVKPWRYMVTTDEPPISVYLKKRQPSKAIG